MDPTVMTDLQKKYHLYGWGRFRCGGLVSRPLFAYVVLCICTFVQNFSVNGANNAVISTLERVFYMDSVQSGFFLALYDLATVVSAPVVGYLGGSYSSPMFFSLNMIIVAVGNAVVASSNFLNRDSRSSLNPDWTHNAFSPESVLFSCYKGSLAGEFINDTTCLKVQHLSSTVRNAKALLYVGNFITGIGSVALFTIGVAYIERIFPRDKAAYCQAIYFAVGTVGGALGILATGRFLLLYTKLTSRAYLPSWLKPNHPLWVGCWWLPYLIYGSLCFVIGVFVSGLPNFAVPRRRHAAAHNRPMNQDSSTEVATTTTPICTSAQPSTTDLKDTAHTSNGHSKTGVINHAYSTDTIYNQVTPTMATVADSSAAQHITNQTWKDMCSVIVELLKNTRFIFIVLANLFEGILLKGFVPFITKYFEYQHQLDTSTATLITGVIALLSVIIGCPIGAYCMNRFSWSPKRCARVCAIVLTLSSFLFLFLMLSCPELKFDNTSCPLTNAQCCRNTYRPVCDTNDPQKMFLSPCHFGCINQTVIASDNSTLYSSCNCASQATVSETACHFRRIPCVTIFALTMLGATLVVFFTAFVQVPLLQVLLYSVPLPYQNMALALRQTTVRVLGQTTGPLLFGFVFDQTCLVWLTDCYARRTCKVYDNRRMGLSMALSGFFTRFISGIACGVVYIVWKLKHSDGEQTPATTLPVPVAMPTPRNELDEMTRL